MLSVCIIVKNEEHCIESCLKSVVGADEIIVLDTGSTDRTGEIVLKYTDKYYTNEYKWEDSFCNARNYALSKCTGDWILSIDADEHLQEGGIARIRTAIKIAEEHNMKTVNCILTSDDNYDEHYFPRLFKRCPEVFWKGAIHNYLSVAEQNKSDIKIYYGYSKTHQEDPERTLRILKKEVNVNNDCIRELFYLAREYWYKNDYITALYWYHEYLKKAWWVPEIAEANLMIARCYTKINKIIEARAYCITAISLNPDFKEALLFMSDITDQPNSKKWLEYSELANNNNVLFVRKKRENVV